MTYEEYQVFYQRHMNTAKLIIEFIKQSNTK